MTLRTTKEKKEFVEDQVLKCELKSNQDCFVSVFSVDSAGDLVMLVPNKWHPQGMKLEANQPTVFPTAKMSFEFYVSPPHGRTLLKAIATVRPLNISGVTKDRLENEQIIVLGQTKNLKTKGVRVRQSESGDDKKGFDLTADFLDQKFERDEWATSTWIINTRPK